MIEMDPMDNVADINVVSELYEGPEKNGKKHGRGKLIT